MRRTMWQLRRCLQVSGVLLILILSCIMPAAHACGKSGEISQGAAGLSLPTAEVLLIIDGAIDRANVAGEAHLDIGMLQVLPTQGLQTTTAVTDGVRRFDGFLMRDVLSLVCAKGTQVGAQALNNYSVDIPIADFHDYDVLLATHMDGERLLPSGKGPFWIVYPRDQWRQLQDIRYDYRWVWQVNRLTVK